MNTQSGSTTVHIAIIAALAAFVCVPSLFTRDLWNPDEPRYMEVAREMIVLGDPVVPHLNSTIYSEKPPMFFWLAGAVWSMGGGYNSGRVVTFLATFLTLLLVFFVTRKHLDARSALLACGAIMSTLVMMHFAKLGVIDPILMLFETTALVLGFTAFHSKPSFASFCWLGVYAAAAMAVLTKGPVGVIVPASVLLAYGVLNRKDVRLGGFSHLAGLLILAAMVLAWLIPAIRQGGDEYRQAIMVKQNLGRVGHQFGHRNPFYSYLLWAAYGFFPWSLILPIAFTRARREPQPALRRLLTLAILWLVVPTILFSFLSSKRVHYIVPCAPAVGILTAWFFAARDNASDAVATFRPAVWLARIAFGLIAVVSAVLIAAAIAVSLRFPAALLIRDYVKEFAEYLTPLRLVAALGMLMIPLTLGVTGLAITPKKQTTVAWLLVAAVLSLSLPYDLAAAPFVNTFKSARPFSGQVRQYAGDNGRVYMYRDAFSGIYNLYTGYANMPVLPTADSLKTMLKQPGAFVIGDDTAFDEALGPAEKQRFVIFSQQVGHRRICLLGRTPDTKGARDE